MAASSHYTSPFNSTNEPPSAAGGTSPEAKNVLDLIPEGNECPMLDPEEERRLLRARAEKLKQLQDKCQQIQQLNRSLADAGDEEKRLQAECDAYKRLFDPIRRLPKEVLQNLFLHLQDVQPTQNSLDSRSTPWTVAHVSRKWRGVAFNLTRIWEAVNITFRTGTDDKLRGLSYLLGRYLSQSGNKLLNVSLANAVDIEQTHPMLSVLIGSAFRWGRLSVNLNPRQLCALYPAKEFLNALHSLEILFQPRLAFSSSAQYKDGLELFDRASNLRSIAASSSTVSEFKLPWSKITHVQASIPSPESDMAFVLPGSLKLAENAKSCHISVSSKLVIPLEWTRLEMRITRLILTPQHTSSHPFIASFSVVEALGFLTVPILEELHIESTSQTEDLWTLEQFFDRSRCPLRKLSISVPYCSVWASSILRILRRVPDLTELRLEARLSSGFLTDFSTVQKYGPLLKYLMIKNTGGSYFDRSVLLEYSAKAQKDLRMDISCDYYPLPYSSFDTFKCPFGSKSQETGTTESHPSTSAPFGSNSSFKSSFDTFNRPFGSKPSSASPFGSNFTFKFASSSPFGSATPQSPFVPKPSDPGVGNIFRTG